MATLNDLMYAFYGGTPTLSDAAMTYYAAAYAAGVTGSTVIGGAYVGTGSPEGVVTAPIGSMYRDQTAAAPGIWIKTSGTGNTGWEDVVGSGVSGVSSFNTRLGAVTNLAGVNTQTADYTLVLGDRDKLVELNKATAINLTVPPHSSVAFPVGSIVYTSQYGAGAVTIVAGAGVTLRNSVGTLILAGQYADAMLVQRASDEWYVFESNRALASNVAFTPTGQISSTDTQAAVAGVDTRISNMLAFSPEYLKSYMLLYDDFMSSGTATGAIGALGWIATLSSGTIAIPAAGQASVPGFIQCQTTTTSGSAQLSHSILDLSGAPEFICEFRCQLSTLVAVGTQEYTVRFGLADDAALTPSNGFWFEYGPGDTSWHVRTGKSATRSDTDTNLVADTSWHRFRIVSDGGGAITFTIDDANTVTWSTSSSIPTTSEFFCPIMAIGKSVGSTNRNLRIDYFYLKWGVTR